VFVSVFVSVFLAASRAARAFGDRRSRDDA
jgi:hypothetical protein